MLKVLLFLAFICSSHAAQLANGMKIGEVNQTTATVWTRATKNAVASDQEGKWNIIPKGNKPLSTLPYTVPGARGELRISWWIDSSKKQSSEWIKVSEKTDYTHKFQLLDLTPGSQYKVLIEARDTADTNEKTPVVSQLGSFTTAFKADQASPVRFNVMTCQGFWRRDTKDGHKIYTSMQLNKPHFLVNTGDVIYYDKPLPLAKNTKLARYKWNRLYALPGLKDFHSKHSCYYLKDDHDVLKNDAWPGQTYGELTFAEGLRIYREQTTFPEKTPYRTVRWGKHAQVWLMEGRDFRSPNNLKDPKQRTIWGAEQLEWLKETVKKSDATFKFIISPTPIVGPDRTKGKNDNHANASHQHEGDIVREFLSKQANTYVLCGDRHWQYASVDEKTKLKEFGCGPASDIHAGGYSKKEKKSNHTYLKIKGGFLSVSVAEKDGKATATISHHNVDGGVENTEILEAK